ncbi:hypothetical protein [uncultured Tessaracoccus sp.]|uniref:hypothetical protein n=1 Tax=uncultured Tessaracoccus sp. TaxID=905023 RepID=UPI0025FFC486|nr:hypothetical protein [uncultured Tessaracoccus sp.]
MTRLVGPLVVGCCLLLSACSGAPATPAPSSTSTPALPPQPSLPWDEDFASGTELERVEVSGREVWLPEGVRVPADAQVSASTEATLVTQEDDPSRVAQRVARSCAAAGYATHAHHGDVTVWVGHGMAVRLEARAGVQVLAWGPEDLTDAFSKR